MTRLGTLSGRSKRWRTFKELKLTLNLPAQKKGIGLPLLLEVQGKAAAEEVVSELDEFLKGKNAEALLSLHEAGEDLIALHCLEVPSTLHRNLLSTNAIENSFRNTRNKLGRVTRFRAETDQATRWLAFALLEVEKGFRRISGHKDLPKLIAALQTKES